MTGDACALAARPSRLWRVTAPGEKLHRTPSKLPAYNARACGAPNVLSAG